MNARAACAIYTRKSSEEGLEQAFNSLDAQREACLAYIQSQKHEGWTATTERYDDGGFSGGNMDRPGLQKLLTDVQVGKIATVVVYKVDRLTRSLSDFAKIIDIFDRQKVSFVSVTQQFNTTTSMGRLTLNVLLSFAQFERELTGERIRDKIAASKKRGMWMGGLVPPGYDCVDHRLVVNPVEAKTVREIFREYLRLGSVRMLKSYLETAQIRSKVRVSSSGRKSGGACYSRGALHYLLNNRVYTGHIVHHRQAYPGQHESIIEQKLWDQVAARLRANDRAHRQGKSRSTPSLLVGILRDGNGVRYTPTHAVKKGERYRYYSSQTVIQRQGDVPPLTRLSAPDLESIVGDRIRGMLQSLDKFMPGNDNPHSEKVVRRARLVATEWSERKTSNRDGFLRAVTKSVTVGHKSISIEVDRKRLITELFLGHVSQPAFSYGEPGHGTITLTARFLPSDRGAKPHIYVPGLAERTQVSSLVKAVARAHDWYESMISGEVSTVDQLTQKTGVSSAYIQRILPCAVLSPNVVVAILAGGQRPHLTLTELLKDLPMSWRKQQRKLPAIV